jgi:hypothetical protein
MRLRLLQVLVMLSPGIPPHRKAFPAVMELTLIAARSFRAFQLKCNWNVCLMMKRNSIRSVLCSHYPELEAN